MKRNDQRSHYMKYQLKDDYEYEKIIITENMRKSSIERNALTINAENIIKKNKKKRTKTTANYKKHKMKWNNKNHKKNERDKHEYYWLSRTNNVQQNENARTQDYVRNELTMMTQSENWLKTEESHNEKLWMQNQTNSDEVMNRN